MERDANFGVELVPPPAPSRWDEVQQQIGAHDPQFDLGQFLIDAGNVLYLLRLHESASLFGRPPRDLDPFPAALTSELRRDRAELVERSRKAGGEWVRQLSGLQTAPVRLAGDQHWEAIIYWDNYIAELKVVGRDGPIDVRTYENPEWNVTLADYVTFIRPAGTRTAAGLEAPFTWLLHNITPDPGATRRLDRLTNAA